MGIDISHADALEILSTVDNGVLTGISPGKGGRAWLEGEWQLCELEALCVHIRCETGPSAEGAEELISIWRNET